MNKCKMRAPLRCMRRTETNSKEILDAFDQVKMTELISSPNKGEMYVIDGDICNIGDWIVEEQSGDLFVCEDKHFRNRFELIEEPEDPEHEYIEDEHGNLIEKESRAVIYDKAKGLVEWTGDNFEMIRKLVSNQIEMETEGGYLEFYTTNCSPQYSIGDKIDVSCPL